MPNAVRDEEHDRTCSSAQTREVVERGEVYFVPSEMAKRLKREGRWDDETMRVQTTLLYPWLEEGTDK